MLRGDDESAALSVLEAAKANVDDDIAETVSQKSGGKKSGKKNKKKAFTDEDM